MCLTNKIDKDYKVDHLIENIHLLVEISIENNCKREASEWSTLNIIGAGPRCLND